MADLVEYDIDLKELEGLQNLGPRYILARHNHLIPAMDQSTQAADRAVAALVPSYTGQARSSIQSKVYPGTSTIVGAVRTTLRSPNIYVFVMTYGRNPGKKAPPSRALEGWVVARGLSGDPKRTAYLVARSIGRKGNRPGLAMFRRALDATRGQIDAYHQQAVDEIVKELDNGR